MTHWKHHVFSSYNMISLGLLILVLIGLYALFEDKVEFQSGNEESYNEPVRDYLAQSDLSRDEELQKLKSIIQKQNAEIKNQKELLQISKRIQETINEQATSLDRATALNSERLENVTSVLEEALRNNSSYTDTIPINGTVMQMKFQARHDYSRRRQSVQEYCQTHLPSDAALLGSSLNLTRWTHYMWYSASDRFSYCGIAKVGSSTWANHMITLTGRKWRDLIRSFNREGIHPSNRRGAMKERFYALPKNLSLVEAAHAHHLTFTFTRHPFTRLVSGYNQKFAFRDWQHQYADFRSVKNYILSHYRGMTESDSEFRTAIPTPNEFSQYLVDEAKKVGALSLNPHWKPQYLSCPHCLVDFDIIGRVETMDEDNEYIAQMLGVENLLDLHLQANARRPKHPTSELSREKAFFHKVDKTVVERLYQLYKGDFEMFGYDRMEDVFMPGDKP